MAFACRFNNSTGTALTGDGSDTSPYVVSNVRIGTRLRRVANQSIPNDTVTLVSWDTEDQDTDGFITVPSTTITIPGPLAGVYAIAVSISWGIGAINARHFVDFLGTSLNVGARLNGSPVGENSVGGGFIAQCVAGTVQVQVYQNSGGSVNVTGALNFFRIGN